MKNKKQIISLAIFFCLLTTGIVLFAMPKNSSSKDFLDKFGDGGFISRKPCGPPCFLGIIPNVTKESEAVRILKEKGLYNDCDFVNNESESGLRGFNCSNHYISISFFRGTDIVGSVGFEPSAQLTLDLIIAEYGKPDAVSVSSVWFTWEKQPEISMTLFYNGINTSISFGTQKGDTFNLRPDTPITGIGYDSPEFPSIAENAAGNKNLVAWHGYGEYKDVTNP